MKLLNRFARNNELITLATLLFFASTTFALTVKVFLPTSNSPKFNISNLCSELISNSKKLNIGQATDLISISERSPETAIRQVLPQPYCKLSSIELRKGVEARRELYFLDFNARLSMVLLFEENEYIGFRLYSDAPEKMRVIAAQQPALYQEWSMKAGENINGAVIADSLGSMPIWLNGNSPKAPFNGHLRKTASGDLILDSPEIPGYQVKLVGLERSPTGFIKEGQSLGEGRLVLITFMRKQPEGTWAVVEPSKTLVARFFPPH